MTACPKPTQPLTLERHARKLSRKAADASVKAAAKARDGYRCRWPHCEYRAVRQPLDAAHITQAAGMGGDPKLLRTQRQDLMAICRLHHRTGYLSLHNGGLAIEPMTDAGTDGPCNFWARTLNRSSSANHLVARELSPFIYERD